MLRSKILISCCMFVKQSPPWFVCTLSSTICSLTPSHYQYLFVVLNAAATVIPPSGFHLIRVRFKPLRALISPTSAFSANCAFSCYIAFLLDDPVWPLICLLRLSHQMSTWSQRAEGTVRKWLSFRESAAQNLAGAQTIIKPLIRISVWLSHYL